MKFDIIFHRLWDDYITQNPSAGKIYNLFLNEGESVVNDHIAFRTLDYPEINIDILAKPFISNGYAAKGEYVFKEKHLFAKHFELSEDTKSPRIFISQLILSECSQFIQKTLREAFEKVNLRKSAQEELIFSGSLFSPLSYPVFNRLREESEYAAWFYVFGFRVNHFTQTRSSKALTFTGRNKPYFKYWFLRVHYLHLHQGTGRLSTYIHGKCSYEFFSF